MEGTSGIYKIINRANGKYYVGSSCSINKGHYARWRSHRRLLSTNRHSNEHLQRSWNKYGKDSFDFVIVELVPKEKLIEVEQKYLDIAKREKEKTYNLSFIANTIEITDEVRRKISLAGIGNTNSKGKIKSEDTRKLLSNKLKSYHKIAGPEKNPSYDKTPYHFFNEKTKETFTGTPYEMSKRFLLSRVCVLRLRKGFLKHHRGWTILTEPSSPVLEYPQLYHFQK